ncbi:RNA polymerase subunit sigma [Brevibacillus parabrevis]|uniref:sigma factor-like helix-turn-helix DNA-binding protein n=1 Tax=Brevibacillus parabrevis TaxID=54914 RepID=UPI001C246A61|nr:sigma factor-like helix-turn-helix DNA-binding protein [Brevibacillus parabrevis]MBU8715409.1 RNA polymerase subunit sigma [Brevibacillus parabrevis]
MGACAIDITKGHREYSVRYALNDQDGVHAILRDIHRLRERRFMNGDFAAADLISDLNTAITRAKLTKYQSAILYWVYERDMSHGEVGHRLGITRQAVSDAIGVALARIASVFTKWEYGDVVIFEMMEEEENDTA